jgi:flagellar basal body-associated protein FliL
MADTPATPATDKAAPPAAGDNPAPGAAPAGAPAAVAATPGTAAPGTPAAGATAAAPAGAHGAPAAAHAASAAPSAAKKKSKFAGLGATIMEVIAGIKSPDKQTQHAAMLFIASLCGIALVVVLAGVHFYEVRKELRDQMSQSEASKNLDEFMKKQTEEAKKKFTMQALGTFTIQLKPIEGQRAGPGVMNLAEVELQARCDEKETCDSLKDGMAQVSNEITTALGPMDRDDLMTKEGKLHLKKRILDRLNAWLPKGKVEDLYFSSLVIS